MRFSCRLVAVGLLVGVLGCWGGRSGPPAAGTPLTLGEWKGLPAPARYEIETLERLKAGNPGLREQRAWERFTREVVLPLKRKDAAARPDR